MFTAQAYKVMIGCPGDILAEQSAALRVIENWNIQEAEGRGIVLIPETWKGQPINADMFIGIFDSWIGKSIDKVEDYIAKGGKAVLFFKFYNDPNTSMPSEVKELKDFKARVGAECIDFSSTSDFERALFESISSIV